MSELHSSKFLSLVLRHDPARIGISLDSAGWTDVDALLAACAAHGHPLTRGQLDHLVASSDKQRFALSADGTRIRANQGHSVSVELGLAPQQPPARLHHGTVAAALAGIRAEGLQKRARHHVHLSADLPTAKRVGSRRGAPLLLTVRADEMVAAGLLFYRSENGVWLTDHVPPQFIDFPGTPPPRGAPRPRAAGELSDDDITDDTDDADLNPRQRRARIAHTSLAACEQRGYVNDHGEDVALEPAQARAVAGTRLYEQAPPLPPLSASTAPPRMQLEVTAETSNEAIVRLAAIEGAHVGCLNYASAKHPGGGFLHGALAQEEALARSSGLYPCLLTQPSYYQRNLANNVQPAALYLDLTIYSPRVPFFRDDAGGWLDAPVLASVITSPAPNASALRQQGQHDEAGLQQMLQQTLQQTLHRRARIVLAIAAAEGITHLILGAWGAGVFGNDPAMVAEAFASALDEINALGPRFARVTFAIPPGPNHAPFVARFAGR
jgi:putative RNA 2'-phosphotransferase